MGGWVAYCVPWALVFQGLDLLLCRALKSVSGWGRVAWDEYDRATQRGDGGATRGEAIASALVSSLHACACVFAEGVSWCSAQSRLDFTQGSFLHDMRKCVAAGDVLFVCHHALPLLVFAEVLWRASPPCETVAARVLLIEASTPLLYIWRALRSAQHPLHRLAFAWFALVFWAVRGFGLAVYVHWAWTQPLCEPSRAEQTGAFALYGLNVCWCIQIGRVWRSYFGCGCARPAGELKRCAPPADLPPEGGGEGARERRAVRLSA